MDEGGRADQDGRREQVAEQFHFGFVLLGQNYPEEVFGVFFFGVNAEVVLFTPRTRLQSTLWV